MLEPIIIVDSSEIREGKLDELKTAMSELAGFVEAHEPRAIAYNVYLSEDKARVTVFQVHPDSASAEYHMQVSANAFRQFTGLIQLSGIDVHGQPSPDLLERLRRKAQMLGGRFVAVHGLHAGFTRFEEHWAAHAPVHSP